jgi:hypothetical protein
LKRSSWASFLLIGAAFGLVLYLFFGRPLPDWAKNDAQQAQQRLEQVASDIEGQRARIAELVEQDPGFLAELPEVKSARQQLDARAQQVQALQAKYAEAVKPILERDASSEGDELLQAVAPINAELQALQAKAQDAEAAATVQRLLEYKRDHPKIVEGARNAAQTVAGVGADPLVEGGLATSSAQFPEAKDTLEKKRDALVAGAAQVQADLTRLNELAAQQPVDYVATGRLADRVIAQSEALQAQKAGLVSDFAELRRSIDKILIDMKQEDGRYYHQYRVVQDGKSTETGWLEVDAATFRKHEQHLGMSIYSKPEGVLEEDAVEVASPPGYAYVGNPRYGQWQGSGAGSFWVFYGQYALMRDLLWGPGYYRPVPRGDWDGWRDSRRANRPYFGRNNEFGTQGTTTRSRYSGSRYMTDRASRAARRPSPDTTSTRSTSPSRSGGGYRSSRFRGGSFGGGGK